MRAQFSQAAESFYVETREGLYFAVKGLVHPPERLLAILRYVPHPHGERQKDGRRFKRYYHFPEQVGFLQEHYPHYLAFDPACQATMQSVPLDSIVRLYDPRQGLQTILHSAKRQPLEADALALGELLKEESGVPWEALGISGSLLIGLHTADSDLDLSVLGEGHCRAVHRALVKLLDDNEHPQLARLDERGLHNLYQERVADTWMELEDFIALERGKSFQGQIRGRKFFVRFIKQPHEIGERYGDRLYIPLSQVSVEATIARDEEAIFTPCRYTLKDVRFRQGEQVASPSEIVSFRARFCEQAVAGDTVFARGTLERVQAQDGSAWHRLLLGNQQQDTMIRLDAKALD